MNVTACLVVPQSQSQPPPHPHPHPHHKTIRILLGRRRTEDGDDEQLQRFSKILLSQDKVTTFDVLHKTLPFMWNEEDVYDTVNPFGDARQGQYHALWTFDIQNDMLRFTNASRCSQMPLALLRERAVSLADMELLGGPVPPVMEPIVNSELPLWKPEIELDDRMRAFTHRLLRDFHHQWRHILRNHYNTVTLKVLARAIIRLAILDFEVRHNTGGHGPRGVHVWITQLPAWEPFDTDVVRVGNINVVLCQEIQDGLTMVQNHISTRKSGAVESPKMNNSDKPHADYMILSVRHIVLCHLTSADSFEHTAPKPLFNGDAGSNPPSALALDYLIWATTSARTLVSTPLQSLPNEIQSIILDFLSADCGTVVAAKVGCLLGVGLPFMWKDGLLTVTLEGRHTSRPSGSPVESQIWFGKHKSGIVYLARRN